MGFGLGQKRAFGSALQADPFPSDTREAKKQHQSDADRTRGRRRGMEMLGIGSGSIRCIHGAQRMVNPF